MVKVVKNVRDANCITHNGTMHADEVFATAFLELYLENVRVFRTSSIDGLEIKDDVLVYDVGRGKFDHHQTDALKRENGITYSSFGLLWKEFGRDFLIKRGIYNIDDVFNGIDKDFIEAIDADDNGFFPKIDAIYKVKTISNMIKLFNPSFESDENESDQFIKAVNVAKMIFEEEILYVYGKVIADKKVLDVINKMDEGAKYLILDEYLPYEDTILNNESANSVLFVAFPSNRGGYAIKTIAKSLEDKTARMDFPEEWGGLDGEELEKVSGIKGLRFCHVGRFIVSCDTYKAVEEVFDKLCK